MNLAQFHTYKEETYDSYISTLIRNESKDAKKEISRRAKHEIALSQLMQSELAQMASTDKYDLESMTFSVRGDTVTIHDMLLGQAIAELPPNRREVILLSYFLDKNDPQIASDMHLDTDVIFQRRHATLRRLKKMLEVLHYER